jgi:endonuclease III
MLTQKLRSPEMRCVRRRARRATLKLHGQYGSPRLGNVDDPLDELVFIVLSQMTTHKSHERVYWRLREEVPTWEAVRRMDTRDLQRAIGDAGLSYQKAPRIKSILEQVFCDVGRLDLGHLRGRSDSDVLSYLVSLPGVGVKTAKCVMMYALAREVLPVDTHVWRLGRRIGLVAPDLGYHEVHEALEDAIPSKYRYSFHVNGVLHGRTVCLERRPRCEACVLKRMCRRPGA